MEIQHSLDSDNDWQVLCLSLQQLNSVACAQSEFWEENADVLPVVNFHSISTNLGMLGSIVALYFLSVHKPDESEEMFNVK